MGKISCIHLLIYKCFKIESNNRNYISYDAVKEILRRRLHKIPRPLHYVFLREMEEFKLIKKNGSPNSGRFFYELIGGNKDKKINLLVDVI